MHFITCIFLVLTVISIVNSDVSHIVNEQQNVIKTTLSPPHRPYMFAYSAGRYPNHIDRTHSEVSDGTGTVRGAYSYVDPKNQVRTVEYVANQHGYYPILSHEVKNTKAVDLATQRHLELFNKIAQRNSEPSKAIVLPKDTVAVEKAKAMHFTLFEKIAAEHAKIGEEQLALRQAFEATSETTHIEEHIVQ